MKETMTICMISSKIMEDWMYYYSEEVCQAMRDSGMTIQELMKAILNDGLHQVQSEIQQGKDHDEEGKE